MEEGGRGTPSFTSCCLFAMNYKRFWATRRCWWWGFLPVKSDHVVGFTYVVLRKWDAVEFHFYLGLCWGIIKFLLFLFLERCEGLNFNQIFKSVDLLHDLSRERFYIWIERVYYYWIELSIDTIDCTYKEMLGIFKYLGNIETIKFYCYKLFWILRNYILLYTRRG